jgi:hypothetical protein
MSVPNIGPGLPDPAAADDARKGNPAPVYRDERLLDEIEAASTRANSVTYRFGGVRHALSRPAPPPEDGGEFDAHD